MEFEDILVKVGDYGKFQKYLIGVFFIPCALLLPWFSMNNLFFIAVPDHWCKVPEMEPFNLTVEQEQQLMRPMGDPQCSMYNINYTEFLLSSDNWTIPENTTTKQCSNGWHYDKTNYDMTAASQWDMVCSDGHYTSFLLTMASVGSIVGTPIYGSLSDKYGRKHIFFVVTMVTFVTAMASLYVTNFTAFMVLRAINGSLMPSIFQLPFIILLELVGPHMRARMSGIADSCWSIGTCFLPLIAWLTRDWIKFGTITSAIIVVFFLQWPVLTESPRWLLSREKYDEATKIMIRIAKWNGKTIEPAEISQHLHELGKRIKKEQRMDEGEGPSILWKYPQLRKKFIIITFFWIAALTAFYGLQMNVNNLAGNEFLNFFLLALAELPGWFAGWALMEKYGRRFCGVTGLICTGLACFVSAAFPSSAIIASFVAKFCACVSTMAVYQQASELYPTPVRALGLSLNATLAATFTFAVPYIVFLNKYGEYIPFVIMGVICVLAGISSGFLPETLNENLPQTITDEENFGLDQKYFSLYRRKRPSCHMEMTPPIFTTGSFSSKRSSIGKA